MDTREQICWALKLPISDSCFELTNLLQSLPQKNCGDIIPLVIQQIFDVDTGWNLDIIYKDTQQFDFESIILLLNPGGLIFDIIKQLLADNNQFSLSIDTQNTENEILSFNHFQNNAYTSKRNIILSNAFEFYFWKFFGFIDAIKVKEEECVDTLAGSVYEELFTLYCNYFFPYGSYLLHSTNNAFSTFNFRNLPTQRSTLGPRVGRVLGNNRSTFKDPQWGLGSFILDLLLSKYGLTPSTFDVTILDRTDSLINNLLAPSNMPSLIFLQIMMETLVKPFTGSRYQSFMDFQSGSPQSNMPSINEVCLVRLLVKHFLTFCPTNGSKTSSLPPLYDLCQSAGTTVGSPPTSSTQQDSSYKGLNALQQYTTPLAFTLPIYVVPLFVKDDLYRYYSCLFTKWPLLSTFKYPLESWLTYLQPWRYECNLGVGNVRYKSSIYQWKNYVVENPRFYGNLFHQFLTRVIRYDLTLLANAYQLYRVLKIYLKNDLYLILSKAQTERLKDNAGDVKYFGGPETGELIQRRLIPLIRDTLTHLSVANCSGSPTQFKREPFPTPIHGRNNFIGKRINALDKSFTYTLSGFAKYYLCLLAYTILLRAQKFGMTLLMLLRYAWQHYAWYHIKYAYYSAKYNGCFLWGDSSLPEESPYFIRLMASGNTDKNSPFSLFSNDDNSPDQARWEAVERCRFYLEESCQMLSFMFKIEVEPLDQHKKQSSPSSSQINLPAQQLITSSKRSSQASLFPTTQPDTAFLNQITPKWPNRPYEHGYFIEDYDLRPIRSNENALLVRLLHSISTDLNRIYQTRLSIMYHKEDLHFKLVWLLASPFIRMKPIVPETGPKKSPSPYRCYQTTPSSALKHDQGIIIHYKPVISLRFLANYYTLGYSLALLFYAWFSNWSYPKSAAAFMALFYLTSHYTNQNGQSKQESFCAGPLFTHVDVAQIKRYFINIMLLCIFIYSLLVYTLKPTITVW